MDFEIPYLEEKRRKEKKLRRYQIYMLIYSSVIPINLHEKRFSLIFNSSPIAVSYTHLDVYKRQVIAFSTL